MHIIKYHTIGTHKTRTQVLSHNQVLSTTWASTFPCHSNPHEIP